MQQVRTERVSVVLYCLLGTDRGLHGDTREQVGHASDQHLTAAFCVVF